MMLIKRYCVSHKAEANERILQELGPEALILTCTPSKNGKKVIVTAGIDQEEFARFRGPSTPFPADDLEEEKEEAAPAPVSTASKIMETLLQHSIEKVADRHTTRKFLLSHGLDKAIFDTVEEVLSKKFPGVNLTTKGPQREELLEELASLLSPYFPVTDKMGAQGKQPAVIALVGPSSAGVSSFLSRIINEEEYQNSAVITFNDDGAFCKNKENFYIVNDRASLLNALKSAYGSPQIFIDLPQQNPFSECKIDSLKELVKGIPNLELHLVLSAAAKSEDQRHSIRFYQPLTLSSLILTMCDQTTSPTSIANVLVENNLKISLIVSDLNIIIANSSLLVYNLFVTNGLQKEMHTLSTPGFL